jgi:hypothetical protein
VSPAAPAFHLWPGMIVLTHAHRPFMSSERGSEAARQRARQRGSEAAM